MKDFLIDKFKRKHDYLRISLTERCNLRCTYCMPAEGIQLSRHEDIMTYEEIFQIAKEFVDAGVKKIRLTGGEPLVRKDIDVILRSLATLNVELAISTNAVIVDRFINLFKEVGLKKINVSLDSFNEEKNNSITRRNYHQKVINNIDLLLKEGFTVKMNTVVIKGLNDDEIVDFVDYTRDRDISVRFIEFMPFDGNKWDKSRMLSLEEILSKLDNHFGADAYSKISDQENDTSKNYRLKGAKGSFGIISTVTNPFCDTCNRVRLTANGKLKNCLFSPDENDLLSNLRRGNDLSPVINMAVKSKFEMRGGMDTSEKLENPETHSKNRSMVAIGG